MRKFKVKNKPKRKYIRKSNLPERDSLTRTAWYGFVPFFLVAIGLFSTTLITNPFMTKAISSIEIPHEVTHTIAKPFEVTSKALSTTQLPSVSKVDLTPVKQSFITVVKSVLTSLEIGFAVAANFILTSIALMGRLVIVGVTSIVQFTVWLFQLFSRALANTSLFVIEGALWTINAIVAFVGNALRILGEITLTVFRGIVFAIVSIGQAIIAASVAVSNWFMSLMTAIGNAISSFFTAVVNVIKIPFIALSKFYKIIEPGLLFIVRSFTESTNALLNSFAGMLNTISQLTKK